jgi:hypothetical protein
MSTSLMMQKTKRHLAVAFVLLSLILAIGPIGVVSPLGYNNTASAQTTTRRYRVRRHRSFWKKHRDKLTVAGTTLGGAAIGGLAGGKKGAAIGALAGGGGGALYTYKLRRRHRRRY